MEAPLRHRTPNALLEPLPQCTDLLFHLDSTRWLASNCLNCQQHSREQTAMTHSHKAPYTPHQPHSQSSY